MHAHAGRCVIWEVDMTNVVPFRRPDKPVEAPSGIQFKTTADPSALSIVSMIAQDLAKKGVKSVQVTSMNLRTFLDSLKGFVSPLNIAERKKGLADFSDDDLREMLFEGTELQWKEKPAFYRALLEIINERKIR